MTSDTDFKLLSKTGEAFGLREEGLYTQYLFFREVFQDLLGDRQTELKGIGHKDFYVLVQRK